jgi:hypothetical protein
MSLYDMRSVGLSDRTEIMKLRTACISFETLKPTCIPGQFGGAPSYEIPNEHLEGLNSIGFTISEIAQLLGVSERTVYRRMCAFGLKKMQFSDVGEKELSDIVKQTIKDFPKCGERMLLEILRQKDIIVSKYVDGFLF